jgi:hypothetical protein
MRRHEQVREQNSRPFLRRAATWGGRAALALVAGCTVAPATHNQTPSPSSVPGVSSSAPSRAVAGTEQSVPDVPVTCTGVAITPEGHGKLKVTPVLDGTIRNAAKILLMANTGATDGAYINTYAGWGRSLSIPNSGLEEVVSVRFANYGSNIYAPDSPQPLAYYSHPPFPNDGPPNDAQGGFCPLEEYPQQNVPLG